MKALAGLEKVVAALLGAVVAVGVVGCGGGGQTSAIVPDGGGDGGVGGGGGAVDAATDAPLVIPWVEIFDESRLHEVTLAMAPQDWQSIIDDSLGDEWRRATLGYDGVTVPDVGVRPSGESSRFAGNAKMSIRFKFDAFVPGRELGGLDGFTLEGFYDDPSLMRERLSYFVFRKVLPTPREVHARVTVNGQLRGVYGVEELWDGRSLKAAFTEPLGQLYRIRGTADRDPYADFGPAGAAYVPLPWEPKLDRPPEDDAAVGAYAQGVTAGAAGLEQVADVDDLLELLAGDTLTGNIDGIAGRYDSGDHFQYHDPQSGKMFILPWDPDNTFGSINEMPTRSIYQNYGKTALTKLVRDTSELRKRYRAKINALMQALPLDALDAEVDFIFDQIRPAAYADPFKTYSNGTFDFNQTYIKSFAAGRYANLQMQANP